MSETSSEKRKRGRPPKPKLESAGDGDDGEELLAEEMKKTSIDGQQPPQESSASLEPSGEVPKKRGRKPKVKIADSSTLVSEPSPTSKLDDDIKDVLVIASSPNKRGRKPKSAETPSSNVDLDASKVSITTPEVVDVEQKKRRGRKPKAWSDSFVVVESESNQTSPELDADGGSTPQPKKRGRKAKNSTPSAGRKD